jgi:hypothetical protein
MAAMTPAWTLQHGACRAIPRAETSPMSRNAFAQLQLFADARTAADIRHRMRWLSPG